MENQTYPGPDRRQFIRIEHTTPLAYKRCKQETLTKLYRGYTVNISEAGLLCNIKESVDIDDILWLSFEKDILRICEELEKRSLIYQNGIIGKVVRISDNNNGTCNVGIKFITREENSKVSNNLKNLGALV